jgi:hypothetical protein
MVERLRTVVALHRSVECGNAHCGGDGLHCVECDPHDAANGEGTTDLWPCPTLAAIAAGLGYDAGEGGGAA